MSISKYFFTLFLSLLLTSLCFGQISEQSKIDALNNYVNFSNESTHGLLIVHRLLENYNKSINKYVNLPDEQINFYNNKDLPADIFEDPENWFYETSPKEWFEKIKSDKGSLPAITDTKLQSFVSEMMTINMKVNQLRFDLELLIQSIDLTKRENLSKVYDKLEEGVAMYKNFYKNQLLLENEIDSYVKTLKIQSSQIQFPEVMVAMTSVYKTSRKALQALYDKDDDNYADLITAQQNAYKNFEAINLTSYKNTKLVNSRIEMYWSNIKRQAGDAIKVEHAFTEAETIPNEYKLYDKYYYYYNISVINKFNRYGNGIVFEMNRIIDYIGSPVVRLFEMPHYFKVVYPKLLEKTEFLAASDPVVKALPKVIKGRTVVVATRTIKVDSALVHFQLYDHKIIDKDIVSLSFNGDWIVEKYMISDVPYEFTLKLNAEGKNFLLMHADDMGRNPPATIALAYHYKGKKELIILNSDIKKSEVIEIIISK